MALATVVALRLAHPALGLVTLNDGTDTLFVTGTYSMGYSTNIGASADYLADTTYVASLALEYQRRAGLIGVNANVSYTISDYVKNRIYDNTSPSYSLEFDKSTGRLTGVLTLGAAESSQADVAAGVRDVSWTYSAGLNLHYPVIDRYSFSGAFNYNLVDYTQTGGLPLVNVTTYAGALGLFYVLSDDRDLTINYRYRDDLSSDNTFETDQAVNIGVSGRLIWEINGSITLGYQIGTPHGSAQGYLLQGTYRDWTGAGSASWAMNRRLSVEGSLSKDFSTTSTNATADTTAVSVHAVYTLNARLSASTGVGAGFVDYLGPFGLNPGTSTQRRDRYFSWDTGVNYALNEHLKLSLSYAFYRNWSNLGLAVFDTRTTTLAIASRW